jgi:hypothetical protein
MTAAGLSPDVRPPRRVRGGLVEAEPTLRVDCILAGEGL